MLLLIEVLFFRRRRHGFGARKVEAQSGFHGLLDFSVELMRSKMNRLQIFLGRP